jgi:small GTP-binding protein
MNVTRVITVGDSGVGKTAIIHRMKTGEFLTEFRPTVGAGVAVIDRETEFGTGQLQFWDTAGQELYRNIIPIYFKGAVCALLAYSCTDRQSFLHLSDWMEDIRRNSDPDIGVVLIGTKYDLEAREVADDETKAFAQANQLDLFYTSSLSGQGVADLLEYITGNWGGLGKPISPFPAPTTAEPEESTCC